MSNKFNQKGSKATSKKEKVIAVKKSATKQRVPVKISLLHFMPLSFALIVFFLLWLKPYNVNLKDPWFAGAALIDSSRNVTDTNQRKLLLDEAGKKIAEQVQKHPYHARVHYIYGYYWFNRQNWDSAIFQQKEAIRIGAGGIVNQIEYGAQDMLNAAVGNKVIGLMNTGNLKEAAEALENAKTPNMANLGIEKYRGLVFSRQGNSDSALVSFLRYNQKDPNDVSNLTNIAISYNQKNMKDSARVYINKALKLDPNNTNAKLINSQL